MSRVLRDVATIHYGKSQSEVVSEDGDVPIMGTGGVFGMANRGLFSGPAVLVPRKGSLGNSQYIEGPFWPVDTTYAVLPKAGVSARWIYYSLDLHDLTKLNEATGVPSISRDLLERVPLSDVDTAQQNSIAEILSTVDDAIEATEALIAKQQQIKQGLMHDLFTRGVWTAESIARAQQAGSPAATSAKPGQLRPCRETAPELYQESPLGWIPKDWEVKGFNSVFELPSGQVDPTTDQYRDFILVAPDHIEKRSGRLLGKRSASAQGAISGKYLFRAGDIVYSKIRPYLRKAILADFQGLCSADMYPLRLRNNENREFYFALILGEHFSKFAEAVSMRSGFPKINREELSQYNCPYPPIDEQEHTGLIISNLSECQLKLQAELEKLQKQKQGLMQDLLTGRVSVS